VLVSCNIERSGAFVRAVVGPGPDKEIEDCYRTISVMCLGSGIEKALVIGANGDPEAHRALVAGMRCAAVAELSPGFRLALVAAHADVREVYAEAEQEATRAGLHARLFGSETDAIAWLLAA